MKTIFLCAMVMVFVFFAGTALAQQNKRAARQLPKAEKIIKDYVKAGGAKRLGRIKDETRLWTASRDGKIVGSLKMESRAPVSKRTQVTINGATMIRGANARSAWLLAPDGKRRALSEKTTEAVRLEAVLSASHLRDFDKFDIIARTTGEENNAGERAYIVEVGFKNGATKFLYSFSALSKLLVQVTDPATAETAIYGDYRSENGILEPHRIEMRQGDQPPLVFVLQSIQFDTGLSEALFEPPNEKVSAGSPR